MGSKAIKSWRRPELEVLARRGCVTCAGYGFRIAGRLADQICPCVHRTVCRACLAVYREAEEDAGSPGEAYRIDLYLSARRCLPADFWPLFRLHYLDEQDWRACCAALRLDRGTFYHHAYRVEEICGAAFHADGLFPTRAYFARWRREPWCHARHNLERETNRLTLLRYRDQHLPPCGYPTASSVRPWF